MLSSVEAIRVLPGCEWDGKGGLGEQPCVVRYKMCGLAKPAWTCGCSGRFVVGGGVGMSCVDGGIGVLELAVPMQLLVLSEDKGLEVLK